MRITGIFSTDLFGGTLARPLQIIRVTLVNDGPDMIHDRAAVLSVSVHGAGVDTPDPAVVTEIERGEERTVEVGVLIAAPATTGAPRQVTAVAQGRLGRWQATARITVAEPGWTMWMVSHFHYDPVWWNTQGQYTQTWPLLPPDDGGEPEVRTAFELVRLHLEEARIDPDYKFVLAELDYLKPYFDTYPQDRADLLAFIAAGRIEIVGGSYNEPNTNLTSAESTIRNASYGLAYQRQVLGAAPTTSWMLDAFGFDPAYPGLMAAAGMAESSWARGPFHQWGPDRSGVGNEKMQFTSEFEWLSPDGLGLLTSYMPNHYSAGWITQHAADLATAERDAYRQFSELAPVAATPNVLLPVGGDHVVPSTWATAIHRHWNARYVWPRFVTALPSEYFAAVRAAGAARSAWFMPQTRDMNPVYPGKDVTYIDTKQAQRDAEIALLDGERLATVAWLAGASYPRASLDKGWRQLAFGAHHDAITGTEGDQVYLDLLAGWREAFERGDQARRDAAAFLAGLADTAGVATAARTAGDAAGLAAEAAELGGEALGVEALGVEALGVEALGVEALAGVAAAAADGAALAAGMAAADPALASGAGTATSQARAVLVFNTLSWQRSGLARITLEFAAGAASAIRLTDAAGRETHYLAEAVLRHPDGSLARLTLTFRAAAVPPLGYLTYLAAPQPAGAAAGDKPELASWRDTDGLVISNDAFTVTADPGSGSVLSSVLDRRSGTELLAGPGNELVLQEEYPTHPRWGEGPWLLCTKGSWRGSAGLSATVRSQRCPIGSRLVAEYAFDDLVVTAETILWNGADLVEFLTHVDGSIGQDRLLRVRFATNVPGGLPVFQTGLSVVGRAAGPADVDVAEHSYTLDNPAHEWFGVGSTARVALSSLAGERRELAIGVAEVIAPADPAVQTFAPRDPGAGQAHRDEVRSLLIALARQGVTATCSVPDGPRYGSIEVDSNLPDVRISLGGPAENAFTARVLAAAGQAAENELRRQLTADGSARIWVPAARRRSEAFGPGADVRGTTDLPVLIVAGDDLGAAIAALADDLGDAQVEVRYPGTIGDGQAGSAGEPALAPHSVALLNRGLPGSLVTPAGEAFISLMRACSAWPAGTWMDGEKRTVPDGSSFAWQHWSHTYEYALAAGSGDWRSAGFPQAGQEYSHQLLTCEADLHEGPLPPSASLASVAPAGIDLVTLKPRGNPLAPLAQPDPRDGVTARLRSLTGRGAGGTATVRLYQGITSAVVSDLLEQDDLASVRCADGAVTVPAPQAGTMTLGLHPADLLPAARPEVTGTPPEPAQPVFTRYWLHGKGPAPAGNLPVAVHLSPAMVTMQPGGRAALTLTVAGGLDPASGTVTLDVPGGLRLAGPAELPYQLEPGAYVAWDVVLRAPADAVPGRHYLAARIIDEVGQVLEDAVVIAVGEEPPPPPGTPLADLVPNLVALEQAEEAEAELTMISDHLWLAPGERGEIMLTLANNTASQLRGEAQVISPHGSWAALAPWSQGLRADPGTSTTLTFEVAIPPDARPGQRWWALVKVMFFGRLRYSKPIWISVIR